jgi:hypothetical protein
MKMGERGNDVEKSTNGVGKMNDVFRKRDRKVKVFPFLSWEKIFQNREKEEKRSILRSE